MIIRCVKCKKEFNQRKFERTCSNHQHYWRFRNRERNLKNQNEYRKRYRDYLNYFWSIKRQFQNPIHQFVRLSHDEMFYPCFLKFNDSDIERIFASLPRKSRQSLKRLPQIMIHE